MTTFDTGYLNPTGWDRWYLTTCVDRAGVGYVRPDAHVVQSWTYLSGEVGAMVAAESWYFNGAYCCDGHHPGTFRGGVVPEGLVFEKADLASICQAP